MSRMLMNLMNTMITNGKASQATGSLFRFIVVGQTHVLC